MTGRGLVAWLGTRSNTSPFNNASWVVAMGILAVVIPVSDKVASNLVFFAAHAVSPLAWVVLLVVVVVVVWAVLAVTFLALRRLLPPRGYDVAVTAITAVVTWFFVGNALARTLLSSVPALAFVAAALIGIAVALLTRRLAMGTILVVFAAVAASAPLVLSFVNADEAPEEAFTFADVADRPSILWVVSDELQYPAAFTQDGAVRDELPNLKALASEATTYTKAYSAANFTDYAVPSMLSGISDVSAQGSERMQQVRAGVGIVPGLASRYSVVLQSPIYSYECDADACASVGASDGENDLAHYWAFAKDTAAIAGRTALAEPFSGVFPSLDGKWRDFWSGGDEFGDNAEGNTVAAVIAGIDEVQTSDPTAPFLAVWHTIRTHAPWIVDRDGVPIYPARVPVVEGAHMIGAEADQTYTTEELKKLERRLYANSAVDFDRQLGELIDSLKASGRYDNTMIVVTADHGAAMTDRADRRVGDSSVQRWSEIAHVPLVVKAPGQTAPEVVTAPRSTGQIARTVAETAAAQPGAQTVLSPDLSNPLDHGPVFTTIADGRMTPWLYTGLDEVDPWTPDDLTPPDARYPFAIGIDPALLGAPVPANGWTAVANPAVEVLPGESEQKALVVERTTSECPSDPAVGLVTVDDVVVGSVLWEGPNGTSDDRTRGWAIVPAAESASYRFWCPSVPS